MQQNYQKWYELGAKMHKNYNARESRIRKNIVAPYECSKFLKVPSL